MEIEDLAKITDPDVLLLLDECMEKYDSLGRPSDMNDIFEIVINNRSINKNITMKAIKVMEYLLSVIDMEYIKMSIFFLVVLISFTFVLYGE